MSFLTIDQKMDDVPDEGETALAKEDPTLPVGSVPIANSTYPANSHPG